MIKNIKEIENKSDYLDYVHYITRERATKIIKDLIEYCKNVDLNEFDNNREIRSNTCIEIRELVEKSENCNEIAGILFEFDIMGDYRIKNKETLDERINGLIEGYELGTYKR